MHECAINVIVMSPEPEEHRINPQRLPSKPKSGARQLLNGLSLIRGLYAIERRIGNPTPDERLAVRELESAAALVKLRTWVSDTRTKAEADHVSRQGPAATSTSTGKV